MGLTAATTYSVDNDGSKDGGRNSLAIVWIFAATEKFLVSAAI